MCPIFSVVSKKGFDFSAGSLQQLLVQRFKSLIQEEKARNFHLSLSFLPCSVGPLYWWHPQAKQALPLPSLPPIFPAFWPANRGTEKPELSVGGSRSCCLSLVMAAQTLGSICLCMHLNRIFLGLANHGQPSSGLDLVKPEGKSYLFLCRTIKTRADF